MGTRLHRTYLALAAVAVAAGCATVPSPAGSPLAPGLWETRNRPGVATLDGRARNELPLPPLEPERVCLSPADVADPGLFLAGATAPGCRITGSSWAGGRARVEASCPSPDGGKDGKMVLTGRYAADRYAIDFNTRAYGDNGRMGFSGKLIGRRLGDCPPDAPERAAPL
jgi:hypothetical protein